VNTNSGQQSGRGRPPSHRSYWGTGPTPLSGHLGLALLVLTGCEPGGGLRVVNSCEFAIVVNYSENPISAYGDPAMLDVASEILLPSASTLFGVPSYESPGRVVVRVPDGPWSVEIPYILTSGEETSIAVEGASCSALVNGTASTAGR